MEERKRTGFAIVIAFVLMFALLYSFGLNLFLPKPQLELADPNELESSDPGATAPDGGNGGLLLEVTPLTVQKVIATISRYESYSRTMTVSYTWGDTTAALTVQVWEDSGWKRSEVVLPSGITECSIVGNEQLWLWYESAAGEASDEIFRCRVSDLTTDLLQRLPTYEDVFQLDPEQITNAGYVEYKGQPCIYVETEQDDLGYLYRYWISETSGLLMAAETEKSGVLVYKMSSNEVISPFAGSVDTFSLPDGTILF